MYGQVSSSFIREYDVLGLFRLFVSFPGIYGTLRCTVFDANIGTVREFLPFCQRYEYFS